LQAVKRFKVKHNKEGTAKTTLFKFRKYDFGYIDISGQVRNHLLSKNQSYTLRVLAEK